MAEASCRRELDLEIPADEVTQALERVAKEFARVARVPGFRPGKAPVSLIRRRFAEDIKGEVVQSLVPGRVEKAVSEQKLTPVSQPQVDKLDFKIEKQCQRIFALQQPVARDLRLIMAALKINSAPPRGH